MKQVEAEKEEEVDETAEEEEEEEEEEEAITKWLLVETVSTWFSFLVISLSLDFWRDSFKILSVWDD